MGFVNYYQILEVPGQASEQEITAAYRRLALKYHPDKSAETGVEKFFAIHKAYKVLCDPRLRSEHDSKIQRYESINVSMKISEERAQLYERLHKRETRRENDQSTHNFQPRARTPQEQHEASVPKPHPAAHTLEFSEYERTVLQRMRANG